MAYVQDPNTGEWRDTDNPETGNTSGFSGDVGDILRGGAQGAAAGAPLGWQGAAAGAGAGAGGAIFNKLPTEGKIAAAILSPLSAISGLFGLGGGGGPSKSEELDVQRKQLDIKQLVQMLAEMDRTSKGKTKVASMLNSAPSTETSLAYAPLQRKSGGEKSAGPSRYDYQTIDQFLSGIPASGVVSKPGQPFQFATSNASSPDDEEARRRAAAGG